MTSNEASGHDHTVTLRAVGGKRGKPLTFIIDKCDNKDTRKTRCWDRHGRFAIKMPDQ